MNWLNSLLAALISGAAGLVLTGFPANACVSWYSVSSREGAAGYFVIFPVLGGWIAGLIVGLISARVIGAHDGHGFAREAGGALAVVLAITAIAALLCRWLADVPPTLDGRELTLEVEPRGGVPGGGGRKVNATPVDEDPGYHGAAGVSIRFSGWMSAVRVLREKCGGTFTNEPQSFLELSRVRTDRPVMRGNVCRGASYYLHPWAGV